MSVIVTGMEMPKSCGECNASGTGVCRKWVSVKELGSKRSELCPLKSVDGLIEEIKRKGYCKDEYGCIRADILTVGCVAKIIKEYCGMEEE